MDLGRAKVRFGHERLSDHPPATSGLPFKAVIIRNGPGKSQRASGIARWRVKPNLLAPAPRVIHSARAQAARTVSERRRRGRGRAATGLHWRPTTIRCASRKYIVGASMTPTFVITSLRSDEVANSLAFSYRKCDQPRSWGRIMFACAVSNRNSSAGLPASTAPASVRTLT